MGTLRATRYKISACALSISPTDKPNMMPERRSLTVDPPRNWDKASSAATIIMSIFADVCLVHSDTSQSICSLSILHLFEILNTFWGEYEGNIRFILLSYTP